MDDAIYVAIISVITIILVILGIYHLIVKSDLETENNFLKTEINSKNKEIEELSKDINFLEEEKQDITNQLGEISNELIEVKTEAFNTLKEVENFENQIKNSLEWFSENLNINQYDEFHSIEKDIKRNCVKIGDKCEIKLSCLNYVNNEENGFYYQNDTGDELNSLLDIYEKEGGDCEDYSLLAIAELNYIKDYCEKEDMNETVYYAWVEDEDKKHFVEWSNNYYIRKAQDYEFSLPYYYTVCGDFNGGHCVIAFSEHPLNNTEESINNALLVEPQTGEIVADFRRESHDYIFLAFYNDMYLLNKGWNSYSDFIIKIEDLSNNLQSLIQIREK
ncbi:hypothetical protein KY334_02970 [Candidatus Woesearchaeota archaeon]|nr:hypothetical protein [Candidatus Woesearchaeota archaeon]